MLSFEQALHDGGWEQDHPTLGMMSTYFKKFPNGIEICLEPLLFDDQFYLAVYDKDKNLLFEKLPIKPGKI